jgi:hypothetical protein
MEAGDEVRIVFGSDVPMIVRPVNGFFFWKHKSDQSNRGTGDRQNTVGEVPCQKYLSSCIRDRLRSRAAVLQEDRQDYAPFVAAVFTDWHIPAATHPDAANIVFNLGQLKTLHIMQLARDSMEIESIFEKGMRECEQLVGSFGKSDRKLMAKAHKLVKDNQAAIASKQEAPELFDGAIMALNQTHTLVGDCYVHGIMDGEMMVGFDQSVLNGDPIRTEVTPSDRIVLG